MVADSLDRFRAQVTETDGEIRLCLGCLRETAPGRAELRRAIEWLGEALALLVVPRFEVERLGVLGHDTAAGAVGHEVVTAPFRLETGPADDERIRTHLAGIRSDLLSPRKHFDHLASRAFPAVAAALQDLGRDDLLSPDDGILGTSYGFRSGPANAQDGDVERPRSRADLMFGVPIKIAAPPSRRHEQTVAVLEHGVPVLQALVVKAAKELERLIGEERGKYCAETIAGRFAWYLFDRYLALTGDQDLRSRLAEDWPDVAPPLETALARVVLPAVERNRLIGDVLVIQFRVTQHSPDARQHLIRRGIKTVEDLLRALKGTGYDRMEAKGPAAGFRRVDKIFEAIAAPCEAGRVLTVDWSPLFRAIRFPRELQEA